MLNTNLNKIKFILRSVKLNLNLLFFVVPGYQFSTNYGQYYKNKKLLFCFYIFIKKIVYFFIFKPKEINFIYDLNVLPFTNADILNTFSTTRLLKLKFDIKSINFFFYYDKNLKKKKFKKFDDPLVIKKNLNPSFYEKKKEKELVNIIKFLRDFDLGINIKIIYKKKEFQKILDQKNIFNKKLIISNFAIHRISHNLNNYFYMSLNKYKKKNFLIKIKNFKNVKLKKKLPKKFISIGVRSSKSDWTRNNSLSEIKYLIHNISKKYRKSKILILSDKKNLENIKNKLKSKVLYSCDYLNPNYFNNGYLIIRSKKYFQYKGMGLSWFAENSKIPYDLSHEKRTHEKFDKEVLIKMKNKLIRNAWQSQNQKFEYIESIYAKKNI